MGVMGRILLSHLDETALHYDVYFVGINAFFHGTPVEHHTLLRGDHTVGQDGIDEFFELRGIHKKFLISTKLVRFSLFS